MIMPANSTGPKAATSIFRIDVTVIGLISKALLREGSLAH